MRCGYCHNPDLVLAKGTGYDQKSVTEFLKKRIGLLDGVVLSGGEATLYRKIDLLCEMIKTLGFAIKLDTNGLRFDVVARLLERGLLDYVALDYKAPREKFHDVTGSHDFKSFAKTLDLLLESETAFEVRTTYHSGLLEMEDLMMIMQDLKKRGYSQTYYIQQAMGERTLGNLGESRLLERSRLPACLPVSIR